MEEETAGDPVAVAEENARRKALAVSATLEGEPALVLGVDTLVAVDDDILGKPRDAAQAREYLGRLAGRTHQVVGGFAVITDGGPPVWGSDVTHVRFRAAGPAELDRYVATGEWRGRAGGYAIQGVGAVLVGGIDGDYLNVVGLPLARLLDLSGGPFAAFFGASPLR